TLKPLMRALGQLSRHQDMPGLYYDNIYGVLRLREQIARLMLDSGCNLTANDVIITSPSFFGAMQTLKGVGMKALEIPTDPLTGISLEALELALEQWPIKVIQLTPNCNNPLGY
ncbi:GntR family transcriptional regulator/aminotransferase, class I, partial [Pseudomonas syringae pv. actinidiae ICMP 18804]